MTYWKIDVVLCQLGSSVAISVSQSASAVVFGAQ